MTRYFVCAIALCVLVSCTASTSPRYAPSTGGEPTIRVLLKNQTQRVVVGASRGMSVASAGGAVMLSSDGKSTARLSLVAPSINVELGGRVAALERVIIRAKNGGTLSFDGANYDGEMHVATEGDGSLILTNVLGLERYLEGVVPHEIGDPGPDGFQAVKVQAVAARTYALSKIEAKKNAPFDVHASVMDQVYRGADNQRSVSSAAVRDTRGRVLNFKGEMVRAYYSACCGGHTSDIRLVWPKREPADYLYGVRDGAANGRAFCSAYKKFRWRFSFTGLELGEMLRNTIPARTGRSADDVGVVKDVRVRSRSRSGRVMAVDIETTTETFSFTGDEVRWILMSDWRNNRILPSVMFRLEKVTERDRLAFISIVGGGNGHGVGMCQNGAIQMSRVGYTDQMILAHYYPGCSITRKY